MSRIGRGPSEEAVLNPYFTDERLLKNAVVRAEQAEAEIERLKCCGNCVSCDFDEVYYCGDFQTKDEDGASRPWTWKTLPSDPCHFAPSRWAERGTP